MLPGQVFHAGQHVYRETNRNTLFFWCIIHVTILSHKWIHIKCGKAAYIPRAKALSFIHMYHFARIGR